MQFQNNHEIIAIVDFGSQVTKLIARRVRELGVYSEILTPKQIKKIKDYKRIKGIILSGGPSTVTTQSFKVFQEKSLEKKFRCLEYVMDYS